MFRGLAVAIAVFLAAPFAMAQAPAPATARISDVAWLEGYWVGEGFGGLVEESWLPARNGVMVGVFRSFKADGTPSFYEILGIEETEGTLRLVVKHFHPDWVGWEEKDGAVRLRLTRISPTEAAFGGVVLKRGADDELFVEVTMRRKDGTSSTNVLKLKRKR